MNEHKENTDSNEEPKTTIPQSDVYTKRDSIDMLSGKEYLSLNRHRMWTDAPGDALGASFPTP